ncbi:ATP-binding protein [Streptomyces sp. NPDC001828]|uniref:sensor histidine kinase n=1 Tax=Streptomyces sp. NPDC001828 TaxID=3364615 RepID=UPI0036B3A076
MSDSAFPPRPAATGHRRRRAVPQIDSFTLGRVRRAVMLPLLLLAALAGGAVIAWLTAAVSPGWLLVCTFCGLAAIAGVAARVARTAAGAIQAAVEERQASEQAVLAGNAAASEQQWTAELAALAGDAAAVEKSVLWSADELCRGARPPLPERRMPAPAAATAEIGKALGALQVQAVTALIRVHDESQSVVLLQVLRRLAQREHALVGKALEALNQLERLTDDPELLDKIFRIDHLVTRMRRQVESTAVLGGQSLRSTRQPVSVTITLRGAVSEVVQYPRVVVAAGSVGVQLGLPGHVGPDLSHLLAELIENACESSDPVTKVMVRAERVPNGLVVEVEDRAIPMSPQARAQMNRLLKAPDEVDVSAQVRAGQLGLLVAAKIAQSHNLSVHLQENAMGGTTAQVVIPKRLLVAIEPAGTVSPRRDVRPAGPPPGQTGAALAPSTNPGGRPTATTTPSAESAGHAAPATALPRRTRQPGSARPPVERENVPAAAPRPGLAGAFRRGVQAGGDPAILLDPDGPTRP